MVFTFYQMAAFFYIYSFLGWCVEVAYQGVTNGKLVNRGFLNGPVCPIYGIGMLGVLVILTPLQNNILILFLGGIVITTAIELIGGWALDRMFHMRWWDYSDKPFNVHGYICLEFCLIWGIGVTFVVRLIHPFIEGGLNRVPHIVGIILIVIATVTMVSDIIVTYKTVIGITKSLGEIEKIAGTLREISDNLTEKVGTTAIAATEKAELSKEIIVETIEAAKAESERKIAARRQELEEKYVEMEKRYSSNIEKLLKQSRRMVKAFPKMHISSQKNSLKEYLKTLKKS